MAAIPSTNPTARILVVDDEESMRHMLTTVLSREGYAVTAAADAESALKAAAEDPFDVGVTDVRMPGATDGMGLVAALKQAGHEAPVIVMSAYGSREVALESVRKGAFDYLDKPFTADEIAVKVAMALEREKLRTEVRLLKAALHTEAGPGALIGRSSAMQAIYLTIRKIGPVPSTVLVTGENPSWSPNSRTLIYNHGSPGRQTLSVLDVFTKQYKDCHRALTLGSNSQPAWAR